MKRIGAAARFAGGVAAAARGAAMLSARPRLWGWLAAPLLVNIVVVLLLGSAALTLVYQFSQWLHPHFAAADGAQSWPSWLLEWSLFGLAILVAILPLLAVWKVLELILFGVAYAKITESVEREMLRPGEALRPLTMLQDLVDAIRNALILIAGLSVIFLLNFVPLIGVFLSLMLGLLWGAFVQGLDLLGICRALRGDRRGTQIQYCLRNSMETLGLGILGFLFGFFPLVGPLVVASCAVGAVLLHREIEQRNGLGPAGVAS